MNDIDKLRMLLPHWGEHNAEHAAEFRTWAERSRQAGHEQAAAYIDAAALKMEDAHQDLWHAMELLGEASQPSPHDHAPSHRPHD